MAYTEEELKKELETKEYEYGFYTDIESDTFAKGLNEEIVTAISKRKKEPDWMLEWRINAFNAWKKMEEPDWDNIKYKKPDYQNISYYSAPKKKEKYMSAAMKKHFVAVLLLWREHLKEEMQKTFDHLRTKGETFADPVDRASQEEEFSFELRTRDRERKLINKIAVSLELIKQDEYGWCESCGVEIGIKRLEARPTATHCIDCKTLDEIKEKQLSG